MAQRGKKPIKRSRGRPRGRRQQERTRLSPHALPFIYMLVGALLWAYGPWLWQQGLKPHVSHLWQHASPKALQPKTEQKPAKPMPEHKPEITFHFYQMLTDKHIAEPAATDRKALSGYVLQIGAFKGTSACRTQAKALKQAKWSVLTDAYQQDGGQWCRVMVGPFATLSEAYQAKNQLYQLGYNGLLKSYTK